MAHSREVARFIRVAPGGHWEWTAPRRPTFREMRELFGMTPRGSHSDCGELDCLNPLHTRPVSVTGPAA